MLYILTMLDFRMMLDKRELRKEKVREAIKQAALKIAENEGWQKVTIRKIADEVLYTPPIVYEFFKNKDDLYRHLVKDGFELLNQAIFSKVDKKETVEEKLFAIAEERFDFVTEYQTLHHMMFDAENPEWQKREIIKSMKAVSELTEGLLAEISGNTAQAHEYFLNMVCLIKGYVYFHKQISKMPVKMKRRLLKDRKNIKPMFLDAFKRFINSIKNQE
ncbi:MAG: TetR/AcrR family transcriptional regulator [Bacteroidota bacterium]